MKDKATAKFRLASKKWLQDEWFSHKELTDIEVIDLQSHDIVASVDPYRSRNWEIQSSVDDGKSWQTQRNVQISY